MNLPGTVFLTELLAEAKTLGFGINLGFNGVDWSCALYALWRAERYAGMRTYACMQGSSMEEALGLALAEVKTPSPSRPGASSSLSQEELNNILKELEL